MALDHLLLVITESSCSTCGNRWISSEPHYTDRRGTYWGARVPSNISPTLPVASKHFVKYPPHTICFRCIPPEVPNWLGRSELLDNKKPKPTVKPVTNLEDLLP